MNTTPLNDSVDIPDGISDLAGFRRWVRLTTSPREEASVEKEGYLELEGTPDMVLEIIGASSVEKGSDTPFDLYGAREFRNTGLSMPGHLSPSELSRIHDLHRPVTAQLAACRCPNSEALTNRISTT